MLILIPALPVVYKHLLISDQISQTVIAGLFAMAGSYLGVNFLTKKVDPND